MNQQVIIKFLKKQNRYFLVKRLKGINGFVGEPYQAVRKLEKYGMVETMMMVPLDPTERKSPKLMLHVRVVRG